MLTKHPQEQVILVNELDEEIGLADKLEAHKQGLLHRAFSVFLFRKINNKYQLLLQQRNPNKYHCGGLWTNTCCSHPRAGETVELAAHRRLKEEMGIETPLERVGQFCYRAELDNGLIEHELDHVFMGFYESDTCTPDPIEVSNYKWETLDHLQTLMKNNPQAYTPWFEQALGVVLLRLAI